MTEVRSRALAGLAEVFFGFTGLGRIYLGSYFIGFLKFALALAFVVLWSVPTSLDAEAESGLPQPITEDQYVRGVYHQRARMIVTILMVVLTVVDLMKYADNAVRESPVPLYCSDGCGWTWSQPRSQSERLASVSLGYLAAFLVPIGMVLWLFGL